MTVLVEEGCLVLDGRSVVVLHRFAPLAILLSPLGFYLVLAQLLVCPNAVHRHLRDVPSVAVPVVEFRSVCMTAQADGIPLGKEFAEVPALLGFSIASSSVVEPSATAAVVGEDGAMNHDERVACPLSVGQQALHLAIVWMIEVHHDVGILADMEGESRLLDSLSQFLRHSLRHVAMIHLLGIRASYVVVAHYGHERQSAQLGLEAVHHVAQHPLVNLAAAAVALDQVAHLHDHLRVAGDEPLRSLHQSWASLAPHLAVACELCSLYSIEPFHLLVVVRVVHAGGLRVEMGVAQEHDAVFLVCSCPCLQGIPGSAHSQSHQASTCQVDELPSVHSAFLYRFWSNFPAKLVFSWAKSLTL